MDQVRMANDSKGARSYKSEVIGDSMSLTINFKWLIQLIVAVAMIVYGWWQLEARIQALERNMGVATEQVELLNKKEDWQKKDIKKKWKKN